MPAPDDLKTGTRVHNSEKEEFDENEITVEKCINCSRYTPIIELDENDLCFSCQNLDIEEEPCNEQGS
jgi:hypothetical protein